MRESSKNDNIRQLKYAERGFIARSANALFLRAIQEMLPKQTVSRILDVGCGEGVPLLQVGSMSKKVQLVGFDLDLDRVQLGRDNISSALLFVANAHHIPFPDATFDIVMCLETLEHVGEPMISVTEIARVTKRYALFSVPNEPWWRFANMARLKYLRDFGNTPGHINHWTYSGFRDLISSRFRIVEQRHPFLWNFILAEKM